MRRKQLILLTGCLLLHSNSAIALPDWLSRRSIPLAGIRGGGYRSAGSSISSSQSTSLQETASATATLSTGKTNQKAEPIHLTFSGEFSHHEDLGELSSSTTPEELQLSFHRHRDLLLKGGGHRTESVSPTPSLVQIWNRRAREVGANVNAQPNDEILAIHSTVPLFPGLTIQAVSVTGCRTIPNDKNDDNNLSTLETILLEERYAPKGPKMMVWIFDQMTGGGSSSAAAKTSNTKDKSAKPDSLESALTQNRETETVCRIGLEETNPGNYRLSYWGMVKVKTSVPPSMLRFLPMSTDRVERKVSKSIVQQLKREAERSLQKFAAAWKEDFAPRDDKSSSSQTDNS